MQDDIYTLPASASFISESCCLHTPVDSVRRDRLTACVSLLRALSSSAAQASLIVGRYSESTIMLMHRWKMVL